ncbi:MAG: COX15/CtaA family protein [Deltaproteobacteria bacterium]|nr:COX15/CtaA family protein [Deltaproteobacteria bacterium]
MIKALKILLFLTFVLICWGAVVRSTGSGLGCPDWPLCHGQWIPPFDTATLIEYTHRLLASLVGFVTLGVCIAVWSNKEYRSMFGKRAALILVLLLFQAVLGGITVETGLQPPIVTTHLAVGLIFIGLLYFFYLRLKVGGEKKNAPKNFWYHFSHIAGTLLFLQILLGGMVASSHAGLACPDFPKCQGLWWPGFEGLVGLQFAHRLGAFVVITMSFITAIKRWPSPVARNLFLLGVLQILLGIGNVFMGLPLWMRVAHLGVAVLLFLGFIRSTYELRRCVNP